MRKLTKIITKTFEPQQQQEDGVVCCSSFIKRIDYYENIDWSVIDRRWLNSTTSKIKKSKAAALHLLPLVVFSCSSSISSTLLSAYLKSDSWVNWISSGRSNLETETQVVNKMSISWSKFHEKHGSSTKPQHIYGSYISDPRQYERSSQNKLSLLTKVFSCLGCLIGKGGGNHSHHSRPSMQQNINTRYIYNLSSNNDFNYDHTASMNSYERQPIMKSGRNSPKSAMMFKRSKNTGNIIYVS